MTIVKTIAKYQRVNPVRPDTMDTFSVYERDAVGLYFLSIPMGVTYYKRPFKSLAEIEEMAKEYGFVRV